MSTPSPFARELARQMLDAIRSAPPAAGSDGKPSAHEVAQACDILRVAVGRFAGADGFAALLRRALMLARKDFPDLQAARLDAGCRIEGLEETASGKRGAQAAVGLAAHVIELLVTFIGEPLTLRVVREARPDIDPGEDVTR